MRRLIAITLLALAAGCTRDQHKRTLALISPDAATTVPAVANPTGDTVWPESAKRLLIFGGQSNGAELYDKGEDQVYAAMGHRDKAQLVPISCSVGGSSIDSWQPGMPNFEKCVNDVRRFGYPVEAIIFWQGEQEGQNGGADQWAQKFTNYANTLRSRVNAPNAPIVWARLGDVDTATYPYKSVLRNDQENVFVNKGSMVDLDGIPVGPDGTHYVQPGLGEAGRRFGVALAALLQ